jgi:hypothetical protein
VLVHDYTGLGTASVHGDMVWGMVRVHCGMGLGMVRGCHEEGKLHCKNWQHCSCKMSWLREPCIV